MAQKGVQLDRETFSCSICLDLLTVPVTTSCGHSYCMKCIKGFWDEEDQKGIHSCPQCRKTFRPRPVLEKNTMLASLMEQLRTIGLQAAPADHSYAEAENVACDSCTVRKLKAIKSCLVCLVSFCEQHLQPHYDSATFRKHKLVEPSKNLQENICPRHDEVIRMFCRTDQKRICYLCSVDGHQGHDIVLAAAERTERQKELEVRQGKVQQRIQEKQKDVKLLLEQVKSIDCSADKSVEDCEKIFSELIRVVQERSSKVKQQIRSQQETQVSQVKELMKKLEQEITELRRNDAELKQLSNTEDSNQFLNTYLSLSALSESTQSSSINIRLPRYFEDMTAAVSELRDKLQNIMRTSISPTATDVVVLLPQAEPKIRADFLKYWCQLTLDPNTANRQLLLSEGNRKVSCREYLLSYQKHKDRFTEVLQVLSKESLTGRCYWEVDWDGSVNVAVSYKNIKRSGGGADCLFGRNDKSWTLRHFMNSCKFMHNDREKHVSCFQSSRIGVYLDHRAGILSFYSVSKTSMTLLHRVQTVFTLPLHAGVWVCNQSSAEFCKLTHRLD